MPVKMYRSTDQGAPELNGLVGSAVALLDACLVNGYGGFAISNITRSGGVVTVTCSSSHGLSDFDWVRISGASEPEYQDEFQIIKVDDLTFTFSAPETYPANATGTLTGKRASGNFERPFTSANGYRVVYRSSDPAGRRFFYQLVDDSASFSAGSQNASLRGYRSMVDVDCGEDPFPTPQQVQKGLLIRKSHSADSTARAWTLFTDGKTVYLTVWPYTTKSGLGYTNYGRNAGFGDFYAPWDPNAAFVTGCTTDSGDVTSTDAGGWAHPGNSANILNAWAPLAIARGPAGNTGSVYQTALFGVGDQGGYALGYRTFLPGPGSMPKMFCAPIKMAQPGAGLSGDGGAVSYVYRGILPGIYDNWMGRNMSHGRVFTDFEGLEGRRLISHWTTGYANYQSGLLVDLTGPWS